MTEFALDPARLINTQFKEGDLYKRLGVPSNATREQMTRRYQGIKATIHPDSAHLPNFTADQINLAMDAYTEAYEILKHEDSRATYDSSQGRTPARRSRTEEDSQGTTSERDPYKDIFGQRAGFDEAFDTGFNNEESSHSETTPNAKRGPSRETVISEVGKIFGRSDLSHKDRLNLYVKIRNESSHQGVVDPVELDSVAVPMMKSAIMHIFDDTNFSQQNRLISYVNYRIAVGKFTTVDVSGLDKEATPKMKSAIAHIFADTNFPHQGRLTTYVNYRNAAERFTTVDVSGLDKEATPKMKSAIADIFADTNFTHQGRLTTYVIYRNAAERFTTVDVSGLDKEATPKMKSAIADIFADTNFSRQGRLTTYLNYRRAVGRHTHVNMEQLDHHVKGQILTEAQHILNSSAGTKSSRRTELNIYMNAAVRAGILQQSDFDRI